MSDGLSEMIYEEQLLKPQQATLLRRSLENDDDSIPEHRQEENNEPQAFLNENNSYLDNVNNPSHYNRGGIECVDAIEAAITGLPAKEAYHTASIIKYVWRWYWKGHFESLRKARWHINRLLGDN